jgi:hypothetical protein
MLAGRDSGEKPSPFAGERPGNSLQKGHSVKSYHPARSDHAARASSSLGMQSGPRAPQCAHSIAVAHVPGSRKKRQLTFPQKGQGGGLETGVFMPEI